MKIRGNGTSFPLLTSYSLTFGTTISFHENGIVVWLLSPFVNGAIIHSGILALSVYLPLSPLSLLSSCFSCERIPTLLVSRFDFNMLEKSLCFDIFFHLFLSHNLRVSMDGTKFQNISMLIKAISNKTFPNEQKEVIQFCYWNLRILINSSFEEPQEKKLRFCQTFWNDRKWKWFLCSHLRSTINYTFK